MKTSFFKRFGKDLAAFLQKAYPILNLKPVTIFRKGTEEEWNDYLLTDPTSLTEASPSIFLDEKNHSGNNIWLYENSTFFVTKELMESLQRAGFNDLTFSHNYLL